VKLTQLVRNTGECSASDYQRGTVLEKRNTILIKPFIDLDCGNKKYLQNINKVVKGD